MRSPRFQRLLGSGSGRLWLVDGAFTPVRRDSVGLRTLVELYSNRYGRPIAITESSLVGTPDEKIEWLEDSTAELTALREEGHDIVGFTWFPLFTLVDWMYRYDQKTADDWFMAFGLIDLVRGADQGLERIKNPAFAAFQAIATRARASAVRSGCGSSGCC